MDRTDPPTSGSEAEVLCGFLDFHRQTLRMKVAGLSPEQLDQTLAPSTMTLGGMLVHLAFVEDWWFTQVFLGKPATAPWGDVDWDLDEDWDWHSAKGRSLEDLQALLDGAIVSSDAVVAEALAAPDGLDALGVRRSERRPENRFSLRWIVAHMIEEYARHNGHADLLRESIDGTVGE